MGKVINIRFPVRPVSRFPYRETGKNGKARTVPECPVSGKPGKTGKPLTLAEFQHGEAVTPGHKNMGSADTWEALSWA